MKKILFLLLFIIVSCSVFSQEVSLEYKFKENANHKFKERTKINLTATVLGETISSVSRTLIDIDETVLSGGENGKVRQVSEVIESVIDDTNNLDQIQEEDKKTTVTYEMDKRGKTLSIVDEKGETFPGFVAADETPIFPDKKVKVGDTWEWKRNVDGVKVKAVCTLEKLYSKEGVDIAKINLKFDDVIKETLEDGVEAPETTVKGTGVFYYAVNYGNDLYISYNIDFETHMESQMDDMVGEASMKTTYEYTYWRYK